MTHSMGECRNNEAGASTEGAAVPAVAAVAAVGRAPATPAALACKQGGSQLQDGGALPHGSPAKGLVVAIGRGAHWTVARQDQLAVISLTNQRAVSCGGLQA